jgi:hypothetical protein
MLMTGPPRDILTSPSTPARRISRTLRRPAETARSGRLCTLDGEGGTTRAKKGTKGWQRIVGHLDAESLVGIMLSSEYRLWSTFQKAVLDAELTRRVLAARRARETSGHWPAGGRYPSQACEDLAWQEIPQPDGTFSIHASGTIPTGAGEVTDLCFTLSR